MVRREENMTTKKNGQHLIFLGIKKPKKSFYALFKLKLQLLQLLKLNNYIISTNIISATILRKPNFVGILTWNSPLLLEHLTESTMLLLTMQCYLQGAGTDYIFDYLQKLMIGAK